MPVPIAELFVAVSADVSGAVTGLNQLNQRVSQTTNQFNQARPAALAMVGAASAVGVAFASATNVAADFESQMSGVRAVMSPAEIAQFGDALTQLALQLGRDTAFSAREAAAGIEELIKAGIPAAAVLEGAGAAATNLAAATGITVAEAATVAAQAINTFGLSASGLEPVVDRLSAVANASAADISFLRFALASVGGVAAGLGLSFEDTAVAIGSISNRFATGADTGTSFKAFLNGLIPDTKAQKEAFKALGLTTEETANAFFTAEGSIKDMADIAGILQQSLSGLTDLERASTLVKIFGTDGQRAAEAFFQLGRGGIQTFNEQTAASGVAAQSAKTRLDNLKGALSNLGSSWETLQITVGNQFLPTIREIVVRVRSLIDGFTNLSPESQRMIPLIVGVGAAFVGVIGGLVLLGSIIPPLIVSFGALNAIMLANPVGLIVTALAALVAIGVVLFNTNEDFRNIVLAVWDAIQNQLVPAVLEAVSALREQLAPIIAEIVTRFQAIIADVGPKVADFFSNTLPAALNALGEQVQSLEPLFLSIFGFFGAISNLLGTIASTGVTALKGLFENVLAPGFERLAQALGPVQPALAGVGSGLDSLVTNFTTIGQFLEPVTQFFTDLAGAINGAAAAIQSFPLPQLLQPGSGITPFGPAPTTPGPQLQPASFTPGGGGGNVVTVNVQTGPVTGEADEVRLAEHIALLISGAVQRVESPVPAGQPGLVTGTI